MWKIIVQSVISVCFVFCVCSGVCVCLAYKDSEVSFYNTCVIALNSSIIAGSVGYAIHEFTEKITQQKCTAYRLAFNDLEMFTHSLVFLCYYSLACAKISCDIYSYLRDMQTSLHSSSTCGETSNLLNTVLKDIVDAVLCENKNYQRYNEILLLFNDAVQNLFAFPCLQSVINQSFLTTLPSAAPLWRAEIVEFILEKKYTTSAMSSRTELQWRKDAAALSQRLQDLLESKKDVITSLEAVISHVNSVVKKLDSDKLQALSQKQQSEFRKRKLPGNSDNLEDNSALWDASVCGFSDDSRDELSRRLGVLREALQEIRGS